MHSRTIIALYAVAIAMGTMTANAVVPTSITVQGKLTNASGDPLPGATSFVFKIFSDTTGGTELWPGGAGEMQTITVATDGLWVGLVGAVSPLTDPVFADSVRWLEINVEGTTLPRVRLVTGPYAYRVSTVDGASGGTITSKVSIGPGHTNTGVDAFVAGNGNQVIADEASVTGGSDNIASGRRAFIGGGDNNTAGDTAAIVVGGYDNLAAKSFAVVSGGRANSATQSASTIAGGQSNIASGDFSSIGGGVSNSVADSGAVVGGGRDNSASGRFSTVGGGRVNKARGRYSVVGGGGPFGSNSAPDSNVARGAFSAIVGGTGNAAIGENSIVGGGEGNSATALGSVITGGGFNAATVNFSFVGGGGGTASSAGNSASNTRAAVVGGAFNTASGNASFVGGGEQNRARGSFSVVTGGGGIFEADSNTASGEFATIPGGRGNRAAADYTFAAGRRARANHAGTFVWADSTDADFASSAADQFLIRAGGGVGIGTTSPLAQLHVMESTTGSVVVNVSSSAVFERSSSNYISIVGGYKSTRGILFADSSTTLSGAILYGSTVENGLDFRTNGTVRMVIDSLGNVGIGDNSPELKLDVVGNVGVTGTICATGAITGNSVGCLSDARFKRHIETLPNALGVVEKLRGVRYEWKTDEFPDRDFVKGEQIGLVAQEVRELVPQAVIEQADGYLAVDYARLVPLLIEAVKEQQKHIDALEKKLDQQAP